MNIEKIDRRNLQAIGEEFEKALKDVADHLGVEIKYSGGSYDLYSGTIKIDVSVKSTADGISGAEAEWKKWAPICGLPDDLFGQTLIFKGTAYEVVGIQPNRPKYMVQIKRVYDSKIFGCTKTSALAGLSPRAA